MLSRRQLLTAMATAPVALRARAEGFAPYRGAMVIDALGGPGDPDESKPFAPLSVRAVADAHASGITAVNITVGGGGDPFEEVVKSIGWCERELSSHPEVFGKVTSAARLRECHAQGKMGLIYGVQGLASIGEDLDRLDTLHMLGLRIAQLTYNLRGVTGDGCLEPGNAGVSRFGRMVIERIDARRMVLDLSHAGRRTTAEAVAAGKQPFITHAGCAALYEHPRNVPDEILRAVAQKGGVVGIYFMPFLREAGQPHLEDVVRHIEHAVDVAGEDHVGIGTDGGITGIAITEAFKKGHIESVRRRKQAGIASPGEVEDVYTFVPELNDPRKLEKLGDALSRHGFSDARVLKILGGNFARGFSEVWG
jgi:membrane dipeptidase